MTRRKHSRCTKNIKMKEICPDEYPLDYNKDVLFTFDQVPVRKILIANIDPLTTHKNLKKRIETYGKIIDCNMKIKPFPKKSYAFITFKDSKSAVSAIKDGYQKRIYVDGQYWRVLPAAAWHQPDRNKSSNNSFINLDIENRWSAYSQYSLNNESPIAKLNEYCLLHIFGYLPVVDIIRIERVCRYWQIISKESLHLYKKFDSIFSNDSWVYIKNSPTLYKILEKYGPFVTTIRDLKLTQLTDRDECVGNSTLIAIAKLCPNMEEINLSNFPFLASGIRALAKNCNKIKRITIGMTSHESCRNKIYGKELSALFLKNRNLQYLRWNYDEINRSCLKHVPTKYITHISLNEQDCSLFVHIISKIPNLFTLDIHSCSDCDALFEDQSFKLNAQNIEKLTITTDGYRNMIYNDNTNIISERPIKDFFKSNNLKYLNLRDAPLEFQTDYLTDQFLFTLAENFNYQLTYVDISGAIWITNSGIISIITSLSQLQHFHMAKMQKYITDEIFCCGMQNLKTLNCSYCPGIGEKGLIKFINNSEILEKLEVRGCPLITNTLIIDAIECTKCRKNEIVLTIDATRTNVNINIRYIEENSPFLRLVTDTKIDVDNFAVSYSEIL